MSSSKTTNGKGDSPRPFSVSQEEYAANWEQAFGKSKTSPASAAKPWILTDADVEIIKRVMNPNDPLGKYRRLRNVQ